MKSIKQVKLGDVAQFIRGINFKPEDVVPVGTDGTVACMRTKNVQEMLDCADVWGVSEGFVRRPEQMLKKGDILVSSANSWNLVGKCCWIPDLPWQTTFGGFVSMLRADSKQTDPRFLYWWFSSDRTQALLRSFGQKTTNISNLNIERCLNLNIPFPSLPEQRRIAAILDQADALRMKRREALAQLDSLTQSIFIEMFGDLISNPNNWPEVGIENVCELIVDCVNRTAPIVDGPTPFKMIRTSNVKDGKVNLTEVRYVTDDTFYRWNRRATPRRGDVLLTREAPVGEAGMLDSDDNVFLGQRLMLYRANLNMLVPEYLLFSFRSTFLQNQFSKHGSGSTVKHLSLPACRSFRIRLPPIATQSEFANRISVIEKLKANQLHSLAELDGLFSSLQHRAFRGEL